MWRRGAGAGHERAGARAQEKEKAARAQRLADLEVERQELEKKEEATAEERRCLPPLVGE